MEINGLKADIHMPNAPKGEGRVHQLPPRCQQHPLLVDEYPACPSNWMNGSDIASSYFLPLEPGKHMWLDFNGNAAHKHHVAVVLSVQGINPITGQQTKQLRLEQYRTNCPVHNQPFKQDRFCEACNYKWPAQNYMTTTSTPTGLFWIDGFRAQDGQVRGFLITEEAVRGVAAQMIGEERVFAIGVAFYLSKEPKPEPVYHHTTNHYSTFGPPLIGSPMKKGPGGSGVTKKYLHEAEPSWVYNGSPDYPYQVDGMITSHTLDAASPCEGSVTMSNSCGGIGGSSVHASSPKLQSRSMLRTASINSVSARGVDAAEVQSDSFGFTEDVQQVEPTKLEIGAGAMIQQELCYHDHNELSFWNEVPAGMLYINYCTAADFAKIKKAGKRQMSGSFLTGLTVGN